MIVSHQHKFIFIKNQKTMGTSIEIALSEFCGARDILTTLKGDEAIRRELGFRGHQNSEISFKDRRIAKYSRKNWFKVLLGRKPYPQIREHADANFARAFLGENIWNSYFKFCFERNPFDKAISQYYWSTRKLVPRPEVNTWIRSVGANKLSNWDNYTINGQVAMDFIGLFETVEQDIDRVSTKVGLPKILLVRTKSNVREDRQHYSKIIDSQARIHIEQVCAREIEMFNYHWVDDALLGNR